jgi:hypothetical protein
MVSFKHKETVGTAFNRLAALKAMGGPYDLSTNLDKYLYEEMKAPIIAGKFNTKDIFGFDRVFKTN